MSTRSIGLGVAFALSLALTSAAPAAQPTRDWTILVFLNADNNLDPFGVKDLDEMKKVGSTDRVNIVVQMDRWKEGGKRYYVKKGEAQVLADLGEPDMGDHKVLVDFAKWGFSEYPSQKRMLVVWNHGSGWDKRRRAGSQRGVSYDETSGNNITTEQLGTATAQIAQAIGKKIDILGFDACLMNMMEVAYEVRANVGLQVGSEETEPGDGWPYNTWLKKLAAAPGMAPRELASQMVSAFASSYWVQKATQSAIVCGALDRLREKLDLLARAVADDTTGQGLAAMKAARAKVARFAVPDNADLFDLVTLFAGSVTSAPLKAAASAVLAEKPISVAANAVHALPLPPKNIHGIAVYFPQGAGWWAGYRRLAFAKESQWDELLQSVCGRPLEADGPFQYLHGKAGLASR